MKEPMNNPTLDKIERIAKAMWDNERPHRGMGSVTSWDDLVKADDKLSREVRDQMRRFAVSAIEALQ